MSNARDLFTPELLSQAEEVQTLNKVRSPLALIDQGGEVIFQNKSASKLFPSKKINIEAVFPPAIASKILSSTTPTSVSFDPSFLIFPLITKQEPSLRLLIFTSKLEEDLDFLSTVTHDLRSPLATTYSYIDALLETPVGNGLADKQKTILKKIRRITRRSIDLVRNYRALSTCNQSKQPVRVKSADLNSCVKNVLDSFSDEDFSRISLATNFCTLMKLAAVGPFEMERIIWNLTSNALRHTPDDQEITVQTYSTEKFVVFKITNNTTKFVATELKSVFENAQQSSAEEPSSKTVEPGMGLGLKIVQQLAEATGSTIKAEHLKDQGIAFSVFFRAA